MIEHERSYVFTHDSATAFLNKVDHLISQGFLNVAHIEDYYLDKQIRIRYEKTGDAESCRITHKEGEKSRGYRLETETDISKAAFDILKEQAGLVVKKDRTTLTESSSKDFQGYTVTMDFVYEPMQLAILEIEAMNEVVYPIPVDITKRLFGVELKECPLCSPTLFCRKIGICGGPSSGKSETAKALSHALNTQLGANSFNVVEFATSFIQKYKKNPDFSDQVLIWLGQHEREISAQTADIVISDCPTFLSYVYMLLLNDRKLDSDSALRLAKIYKRVLFDVLSYTDLIFLKIRDYTNNRVRYQTPDEALEIERRIKQFLDDHCITYTDSDYTHADRLLEDLFYINT